MREVITIKLYSAVLNHIRLTHPPPSSCSNEQEISRYFHRPHLPPSSAMLMEKRLIFYNPKDGGKENGNELTGTTQPENP